MLLNAQNYKIQLFNDWLYCIPDSINKIYQYSDYLSGQTDEYQSILKSVLVKYFFSLNENDAVPYF